MSYLLLHRPEKAAQTCGPWTAGYCLVGILDLAVEIGVCGFGAGASGCGLRGGVLGIAFFLDVVVCRVHGCRL
jgi:hypothetical protein